MQTIRRVHITVGANAAEGRYDAPTINITYMEVTYG